MQQSKQFKIDRLKIHAIAMFGLDRVAPILGSGGTGIGAYALGEGRNALGEEHTYHLVTASVMTRPPQLAALLFSLGCGGFGLLKVPPSTVDTLTSRR